MKQLFCLAKIVVLLVCSSSSIPAGQPATPPIEALTLDQALALAERQHPELAEAKALIDAAEGRVTQAGLFPNPEAIARMESAPLTGRTAREAEYLAGVSQPIPLGGRLGKGRQAEQLDRDRRIRELEVRRRNLQKRIRNAFATALYQTQAHQMQGKITTSLEKSVATTKARVEAGDLWKEELARAEMELLRAQVESKRSAAMHEQAMRALKAAIGNPDLPVKSLAGTLEAAFELSALETFTANLSNSPEMLLAGAEVRWREALLDLAKAERVPELRVEALYRRLEASKENAIDIGVTIPIPLFDRGQGRMREARAELSAAEARARSTENALNVRFQEMRDQFATALANSRILRTEVLPRVDSVLKASEARFEAGDISLAELLPVRRDWAAVQLTYLESLRDVMQAWADLSAFLQKP
ncbi:MAG: TolC family protein [Verrucomicrobiota bacterium]